MRICSLVFLAALTVAWLLPDDEAQAFHPPRRVSNNSAVTWHGGYYHTMWGQPVALVVPPTAEYQTKWSWGVAQTSVEPIWPQFQRGWPGPYEGGMGFLPTPLWPSHTDQFGVYYVRGPW
ncbi:MAG: hypothetical protein WD847_02685 [Pirellulales bacterium]